MSSNFYRCNVIFFLLGFSGCVFGGGFAFNLFTLSIRALSSLHFSSLNASFSTSFFFFGANPSPLLLHPAFLSSKTTFSVRPCFHTQTAFFCSKSLIPAFNLANSDHHPRFGFQSAPATNLGVRTTGRRL